MLFIFWAATTSGQSPQNGQKTAVSLAPGVTRPVGANTKVTPFSAVISRNTLVASSVHPQSEVNISINKTNPQVLLLSSQTFPVTNSWQGAWWSSNGSITWTGSDNLPNNAPGRGDPSTAFDAAGNGFIATMTPVPTDINAEPTGYLVQSTANNGTTWQPQVAGAANIEFDKDMIGTDDVATSPFANNLYGVWMGANNFVQFNRSTNHGVNFSNPITLNNHWGQGANVQTGPTGQVYVCWADYTNGALPEKGLGFTRSLDGGVTFAAAAVAFNYTGIRTSNGGQAEFNNTRVNSFPSMAVDKSNSPHRGRIYVVYAAKQNGNGKAVIQTNWSDNQGVNWSAPAIVSIAAGRQNWFPWVAVDNNGVVFITYYSLDQTSGFSTSTYVATSVDAGTTFTNQVVSSAAHTTAPIPEFGGGYAGDYIGIAAYGWKAYPAWMDNRSGQWQNYVAVADNSPVINGTTAFCTSSSFTLTNVPSWYVPTWTVSPAGVVGLSGSTGLSVTATKQSVGSATLTATINGSTVVAYITTQPQVSNITYNMSGGCNGGIQSWYASATPNMPGATNWQWTVDNPNSGIYINNPGSPSTFFDVSRGGGVSITYSACGVTSLRNGITIWSNCNHSFVVSPNPASSTVTVAPVTDMKASVKAPSITSLTIYDALGNVRKHQAFNKVASASLNVSGLGAGIYYIEITDGTYKERQQIQVIR